MHEPITFITGNANKAEHLGRVLNITVSHHKLDLTEIQSLSLKEVIKHKTDEAYRYMKKPVLVTDVSLTIHALGKLPGPFIKYFLEELGNNGIANLLQNFQDKSAIAMSMIGFHDGKTLHTFKGEIKGKIADKPKGTSGFGWDAIFIPDGYDITRAEMNQEDWDKTSPTGKAVFKLHSWLKT